MSSRAMSRATTSTLSSEPRLGFGAKTLLSLFASFLVGLPVLFIGFKLGFIRSGDEGVWQPYTAASGLLWSTLVFAFVYPAARDRWTHRDRIAASALVGIVATIVVFLASLFWLFAYLIAIGYEGS
jgi:nitric oxide reductase large subunit